LTTTFEDALGTGDIAAIRRVPKSDLHTHATLGGNRAFVRERTGLDVTPLDRVLGSMSDMHR
jgi:hypothetical protein